MVTRTEHSTQTVASPGPHTRAQSLQDAVGLLRHTDGSHSASCPPASPAPLPLGCFALFFKPVALLGVVLIRVQDLGLGIIKPHLVDLRPPS